MSQISKNALKVENNVNFPNNNTGYITPALLREFNVDMIDSTVNQTQFDTASAGWDSSIAALNTFTASQQPSFNALNAFTASQLSINTGVNAFTYSISSSVGGVIGEVDQLQIWSQSVNEIKDDGILQGYSTRLHFYGLVSASIVPNVNGPIASIDILQDGTKLNTSSFNAFQTTTNARLNDIEVWSGSAKISIAALNSYTASAGPVATGSLVSTASYSGTTLTYTKGNGTTFTNVGIQNTASFNSFTSSTNISINALNTFTASNGIASLNTFTASIVGTNAFTASAKLRLNDLEAWSASAKISINALNSYTSSTDAKIESIQRTTASLNSFTASQEAKDIIIANYTASMNLFTASINTYTASNNTKWTTIGLLTGSYATTGSNDFKATQIITGSVRGNVNTLTIAANTASMDLSTSNFFKLNLVSGSTTSLGATNIQPGQTINLLITQPSSGTGSISFNTTYKFPYGVDYTASAASNAQDILTMISFDGSSLYSVAVKQLS